MQRKPTVLLADADVLIDYRESDLAILALVARHLGRLAVLPPVLNLNFESMHESTHCFSG